VQYPYQKVLDAREQREKILRLDLSNIHQRIELCRANRRELLDKQREIMSEMCETAACGSGTSHAVGLGRLRIYRTQLKRCHATAQRLEEQKREVREQLQECARSRKLLEKHREKLLGEERERVARRDRRMTENHAIYNFSESQEEV
jgi:flagellar export protein FliJ